MTTELKTTVAEHAAGSRSEGACGDHPAASVGDTVASIDPSVPSALYATHTRRLLLHADVDRERRVHGRQRSPRAPAPQLHRQAASGCGDCHDTGFKGRTAIFEFLDVDDDLRDLIKAQASTRAYREQVDWIGTRLLREAGIARVVDGATTLEEVPRVT